MLRNCDLIAQRATIVFDVDDAFRLKRSACYQIPDDMRRISANGRGNLHICVGSVSAEQHHHFLILVFFTQQGHPTFCSLE